MKVLWFSNVVLTKDATKATGTWLRTMSEALVERGVEFYNISQSSIAKTIQRNDVGIIKQWVIPVYRLHNGLPENKKIKDICGIVDSIAPDIIHIWGIEGYWGLLTARGYLKGNVLLEIQGIKETCARVFYGGLSLCEIFKTIGVREMIRPSLSLMSLKKDFEKWSKYEREMLGGHKHISTHSDWVRAWISQFTQVGCQIHCTQRIVRKEFLDAGIWEKPNNDRNAPIIFAMSSGPDAYKGIHDAIKAVALLKKDYPKVELRIAGNFGIDKPFYRKPGYTKFLQKLISDLQLDDNIIFLGSLNASQIIAQIHQANAMLQTSYVESYSLAVSEAMMAGVPLVVSYAGAMPELAQDRAAALFYTPSDYFTCAYRIKRIIESTELAESLSKTARGIAVKRNVASLLGDLQINIYKEVLKDEGI